MNFRELLIEIINEIESKYKVVNTRNVGGYGVSHPYPNKKTKPGYGVINPAPDEEKKENKFKPVKVSRAFKKEGEKWA